MLQQAYTPSNTGIASFVHASEDYDLAPIGIGSMKEQADRLAEFGRHGDIYVVHAAEGETVIPMEVLDSIPQVKEMLFSHMRDMGIDPGRYVVGNKLNSINPDTGMPEFFFKKIWSGVKKVFKVVAPILLPIIGNAILPGIGGILASMAYTKLSGGSWADTLKAGVLSYAGGALVSGLGGAVGLGGSTTFLGGLTKGLTAPFTALADPGAAFAKGILGPSAPATPATPATPAAGAASGTTSQVPFNTQLGATGDNLRPPGIFGPTSNLSPGYGDNLIPVESFGTPPDLTPYQMSPAGTAVGGTTSLNLVPQSRLTPTADQGWLDRLDKASSKVGNYLFRAGDTPEQVLAAQDAAGVAYQQRPPGLQSAAGFDAAVAKAGPSIYAKYGPSLALAGGAALAGGVFDAPEDPDAEARREAERRFEAASAPNALLEGDPDSYVVNDLNPYQFSPAPNYRGTESVEFARATAPPPIYQGIPPVDLARATAPPMRLQNNARYYAAPPLQNNPVYARYNAAGGGFIDGQPQYLNYGGMAQYPRREMLVEGPGTERSDDIPAMLSDGEFVLNSRSVRGADPTGQGNRYRGAQNLYNMMRNFEMKG